MIVEGPVKALALRAQGFEAVGLGGTGTTLTTGVDRQLNDSWRAISLEGRIVVVLFDSNRAQNPNVARDEARLAVALERAGASVWTPSLPHAPSGEAWGPDDFLAKHGHARLTTVLESGKPADPIARVRGLALLPPGAIEHELRLLLDDLPFLMAVNERGEGVRRATAQELKAYGIARKDLDAALARVVQLQRHAQRQSVQTGAASAAVVEASYVVHEGKLGMRQDGRNGPVIVTLANFTARIDRDVVHDDGVEKKRVFEVSGATEDGQQLPTVELSSDQFGQERWPLEKWGPVAVVAAISHAAAHLRNAIQVQSNPTTAQIFTHFGFRLLGQKWIFLHAGGAIGAPTVEVHAREQLARYELPRTPLHVADGLRLVLRLREVVTSDVGYLLIALVFRAPLQQMLYCDVTAWIFGRTGTLKSTLAALVMAFYGRFDAEHLPGAWSSTFTALEDLIFRTKDMLCCIDDFAPQSADPHDPVRRTAAVVLRSIGNRSTRGRARADLSMRPPRPPRALVFATAEDLPSGESIIARVFPVEIKAKDVNLPVVTELQAQASRFPDVLAAFVKYLTDHYDDVQAWVRQRFEQLRQQARAEGVHLRSPAAVAHLALGLEAFAHFAEGAYPGQLDAAAFTREGFAALGRLATEQHAATADADPVQRFILTLRTLLARGELRLLERAEDTGDKVADLRAELAAGLDGRKTIGWRSGLKAYIFPETYGVVCAAMRAANEPMPLKQRTLWSRLRDRRLIITEERDHCSVKRTIGGIDVRVIALAPSALVDPVGEDSGGPGVPAGNSGSAESDPGPWNEDDAHIVRALSRTSRAGTPASPGSPGTKKDKGAVEGESSVCRPEGNGEDRGQSAGSPPERAGESGGSGVPSSTSGGVSRAGGGADDADVEEVVL